MSAMRSIAVLLAVSFLLIGGCPMAPPEADDPERRLPDPPQREGIVFSSNVVSIEEQDVWTVEDVDATSVRLRTANGAAMPTVGTILFGSTTGDAEGAYLRRIESIMEDESGLLIAETSVPALDEIIEEGTIEFTLVLGSEPVALPAKTLPQQRRFSLVDLEWDFAGNIYDDGTFSLDLPAARLLVTGELDVQITFSRGARLELFKTDFRGQVTLNMDAAAAAELARDFSGSRQFSVFSSPWLVDWWLWGTVQMDVEAGFEGDASAAGEVETCLDADGRFTAGMQWNRQQGWRTTGTRQSQFDACPLDWTIEGDFATRVYVRPTISLLFYFVAGPQIVVEPYVSLGGSFDSPTCLFAWDVSGGLAGRAGADLGVISSVIPPLPERELFHLTRTVHSGTGTLPLPHCDDEQPPFCGDGICDGNETCETCPEDCGPCPPSCGDGVCDGNETCETCPADCGECPTIVVCTTDPPGTTALDASGQAVVDWVGITPLNSSYTYNWTWRAEDGAVVDTDNAGWDLATFSISKTYSRTQAFIPGRVSGTVTVTDGSSKLGRGECAITITDPEKPELTLQVTGDIENKVTASPTTADDVAPANWLTDGCRSDQPDCRAKYAADTAVTLTAHPIDDPSTGNPVDFAWGGQAPATCLDNQLTCQVLMDSSKVVTVTFAEPGIDVTLDFGGVARINIEGWAGTNDSLRSSVLTINVISDDLGPGETVDLVVKSFTRLVPTPARQVDEVVAEVLGLTKEELALPINRSKTMHCVMNGVSSVESPTGFCEGSRAQIGPDNPVEFYVVTPEIIPLELMDPVRLALLPSSLSITLEVLPVGGSGDSKSFILFVN